MSRTVERTDARAGVEFWLAEFEDALNARDIERVTSLFSEESYWRDLGSFTWNLITVEGRAGIADILRTTLEHTNPKGFTVTTEPAEIDEMIEVWLRFETATGRGTGHLRLADGRAWTLLTTLGGLKGYE